MKKKKELPLTVGDYLPSLVLALEPLPEDDGGSITDAAVVFVAVEGVEVQADVVDHPNAPEALPRVVALRPQDRLVQVLGVVGDESHLRISLRRMRAAPAGSSDPQSQPHPEVVNPCRLKIAR